MLEQVASVSLDASPSPSPARSDLARILKHANLTRMRLLAWVLIISMPVLASVDAWVLMSLGSTGLPEEWRQVMAIRILWAGSAVILLLAGRPPSTPDAITPQHHLAEALFVPAWLAMAGIHSGLGASSGSNISVYLLAIFIAAAFLYMNGKRSVLAYGFAWVVLVGSLVHLHSTEGCLLYTSPSPRDGLLSRMPSSA